MLGMWAGFITTRPPSESDAHFYYTAIFSQMFAQVDCSCFPPLQLWS